MLLDLLLLVLSMVLARAAWRVIDGVKDAFRPPQAGPRRGSSSSGVPAQGVQMARDPVCGTYVVPDRAVSISDGARTVYFCSPGCRDKFRARTA